MADLLMVMSLVVFVGMCVAYVWWCDRIIGPDPVRGETDDSDVSRPVPTEVAA
jgi:hypothetical protein